MNRNVRIAYIDCARALAIFLVVLGHTISGTVSAFLYSFHMPLFFIISGMLLNNRNNSEIRFADTVKKRAFGYMIPYVIWGCFYSQLNLKNFLKLLYGTRECLVAIGSLSSLWFLPVLFCADIIAECLMYTITYIAKGKNRQRLLVFSVMVASFLTGFILPHIEPYGWPFGLDIGFVALGFMLFGFLVRNFFDFINESRSKTVICLVVNIILIIIIYRCLWPIENVSMYMGSYGQLMPFLVKAIIESSVIIFIAVLASHLKFAVNWLMLIGANTMSILVLHKPIVKYLSSKVSAMGCSLESLKIAIPIAIVGLFLSLIIGMIIEKIIPEIVGKRRR